MSERVLYTCPGHSFYVSTVLRDYFVTELGTSTKGYETMAFPLPEGRMLYQYATRSERWARHAHFVISKRLARLHSTEPVSGDSSSEGSVGGGRDE